MTGVYLVACFQTLITIREQRQRGAFMASIFHPLSCTKQGTQKRDPNLDPVTSVSFAVLQVFVFKKKLKGKKVPSIPCQRQRKLYGHVHKRIESLRYDL